MTLAILQAATIFRAKASRMTNVKISNYRVITINKSNFLNFIVGYSACWTTVNLNVVGRDVCTLSQYNKLCVSCDQHRECRVKCRVIVVFIASARAIVINRVFACECLEEAAKMNKKRGGGGPGRHRATTEQP